MPQQPASPIKKIILALSLILVTGGYVVWARITTPTSTLSTTPTTSNPTPTPITITPAPEPTPAPTPTPTPAPTPAPVATGPKNGTYTGATSNTVYGPVQVSAVISGGKLATVNILQYPSDRGTSIRIAQHALPILTQEAIAAQSAQVNTVSGATQTSEGFVESLTSALALANT